MEKLNIDDFKEEEIVFDPAVAFAECLINPDEELTRPPIAISIGYKYEEQVPLVTFGNFCCIVGASKSMKSFLKSAFLACAIGATFKEL
jgi:hypothetical protein